jgi:4-hydroxy-tetrahydrodipicolinate reductase
MKPVRVLLVGAAGRMGQAIQDVAHTAADISIVAAVDVGDRLDEAITNCNVVIDFSHADATTAICDQCVRSKKPLVTGTTGRSAEQERGLGQSARSIALIAAPNFSVGVNALFWLARKAAQLLGPEFDLEVVESHHRLKKDSPSGTAKRLAEILCEVRGLAYDKHVIHGREGLIGERPADQIAVHSIRGGDVVGDHTVVFAARGERIELTHKASSRDTFATGALRAAQWIIGRPPGRYSMEDVLELRH